MSKKNPLLSDLDCNWESDTEKEWTDMPEFLQGDERPHRTIIMHFRNELDVKEFSDLVEQNITSKTKSMFHPKLVREQHNDRIYTSKNKALSCPKYPLYIVSKSRWKSRHTSKALESMNVPYHIVVEKHEYKKYTSVINKKKVLVLPQSYLDEYDTYDDLGDSKSKGPGAARNFCWDHSIDNKFKRHWVMDDNILRFHRLNRNEMNAVNSGTIFRCMEDFVDRYKNVAMAGPQYFMFIARKSKYPHYTLNTRIYSCNLIKNDAPYRWRGRYNEDTDLSLRMLKDKWCTVQFYAFIQDKLTTQTVQGGNTKEFYAEEGTLNKSQMLKDMHPNLTEVVWRFGRWHHYVNYGHFRKNRLIKKKKFKSLEGDTNNYGMELVKVGEQAK